jgi:hypothetical protein
MSFGVTKEPRAHKPSWHASAVAQKKDMRWEVFTLIEPADRLGPQEDTEVFAIRWAATKEPIAYFHLPYRHFLDEVVAEHNKCLDREE